MCGTCDAGEFLAKKAGKTVFKEWNMNKITAHKPAVADVLVAASVLVLSLLVIIVRAGQPGKAAYVYADHGPPQKIELSSDRVLNYKNIEITIRNKKLRVSKSDCPRLICSHSGWISGPEKTIICVPNRMMVEIKNNSEAGAYDTVIY